ncbi:DedA family protein [Sphingomonas sp. SUN019]|uniref:DedA family protein n=1 Tax=Sphingomonas sp. SUN019 TaxID=2937788 RepID=UPI002164126B|nr:DedA family protein [Sphingomonas sp. SUN019]UVO50782.1 DedA family protein [Sphingomonas sp. SUN019]
MSVEAIIARYGVAAIFAGAALEGETIVIAGGLMAHQGLVSLPLAMAAATIGSFCADQTFFAIGRRWRDHPRVRRIMERRAFAKALEWLERYPVGFIFAFRFLYGLRTVSPVAIGTSRVPLRTFMPLNALAAVTWAVTFTSLGYIFGEGITEALGALKPSRGTLIRIAIVAVIIGAAFHAVAWWRKTRK